MALKSTVPELAYSGRRFGGKSWVGCAKAWLYADRNPGARVAICREERASMEATTLVTLRQEIVPAAYWSRYWREGKGVLEFPNGSEIHVFGLDRPGRALGARYGLVVVDQAEQLSFEQFEIINSCAMQVGMPWHQTMLLFNPDSEEHWAYRRYHPDEGDGLRLDDGGKVFAEVVHVLPDDLIGLLSQTSRDRFNRMSGVWYDRYRMGLWRHFEGAVFPTWHPAKRVVDPPAVWADWGGYPPPDWPRGRGIDFGFYPDPFVCFDDRTEVLTETGWKLFEQLLPRERVATVSSDKALEWQVPTAHIEQPYDGPMVTHDAGEQSADFCVTPNHRMVLEHRRTGEVRQFASDRMPRHEWSIPVGGWRAAAGQGDPRFARLLGLIIADGCITQSRGRKYVRIAQKNYVERARKLVRDAGYKASEYTNKGGCVDFAIRSDALYDWLSQRGLRTYSHEKRIPSDSLTMGRPLLEGLMLGDGSADGRRYMTTSSGLASDVQALAAMLGIPSRVRVTNANGKVRFGKPVRDLYTVWFNKRYRAPIEKMDIHRTHYLGMVRCVTVPNGTLVVRRNGRPMLCGNCQWWAKDPGKEHWYRYREKCELSKLADVHAFEILDSEQAELEILRQSAKVLGREKDFASYLAEFQVMASFSDHDRGERELLERPERYGRCVWTQPADKDVLAGLQTLSGMLTDDPQAPQMWLVRGATFMRDAELARLGRPTCMEEEMGRQRWRRAREGDSASARTRQMPVDKDNHCVDAARYLHHSMAGMMEVRVMG